jgi:hypothetical protein
MLLKNDFAAAARLAELPVVTEKLLPLTTMQTTGPSTIQAGGPCAAGSFSMGCRGSFMARLARLYGSTLIRRSSTRAASFLISPPALPQGTIRSSGTLAAMTNSKGSSARISSCTSTISLDRRRLILTLRDEPSLVLRVVNAELSDRRVNGALLVGRFDRTNEGRWRPPQSIDAPAVRSRG